MKKLLTLALAALLVAALAICVSANEDTGYTIFATRGTPTVDGVKDDIWDTTEAQTQENIRSGEDTGTHVTIRFLYDDDNLYLLAEVPDSSLWTKDLTLASNTWQMDGAEICLSLSNNFMTNIDNTTDAWVGVTPYGDFYSSQANWLVGSGDGVSADNEDFDAEYMEVHTSLENDPDNDTAEVFYIEAVWHIKAYDEEFAPADGVVYGFEISYNDNAEFTGRTMCIGWSDPTDAASGNPSVWGEVVLGERAAGAAEEAPAEEAAPAASGDGLKCDGNEYDEAVDAAKALGTNPIVEYEFVEGAETYFSGEGPENLWDDDVFTKFCTDGFPAWSVAQTDKKYSINAIIMATANDNSSNPGRAPAAWTIYGSNDNENWTVIANGGEEFFTEVEGDVDYTYFAAAIAPTDAYSYFKFECTETAANLMQVSEVVLCSADAPAPAEPAPVEEVKEEETEAPTVEEKVEDAVEEVAEAAGDAVEAVENAVSDAADAASEAVTNAAESAKSGCGSFIGGGMIVMISILGSAWIAKRK